jgi:hypothetical protein
MTKVIQKQDQEQWYMHAIPATQELGIGRSKFEAGTGKNQETLFEK